MVPIDEMRDCRWDDVEAGQSTLNRSIGLNPVDIPVDCRPSGMS